MEPWIDQIVAQQETSCSNTYQIVHWKIDCYIVRRHLEAEWIFTTKSFFTETGKFEVKVWKAICYQIQNSLWLNQGVLSDDSRFQIFHTLVHVTICIFTYQHYLDSS